MKKIVILVMCLLLSGCGFGGGRDLSYRDKIVKKLDVECKNSGQCELPFEYAVKSDCPYVSRCISGRCAVVCPDHAECVEDYKKIIFENPSEKYLSAHEIVEEIFSRWLEYHRERKSCSLSWIEDFEIHEVFIVNQDEGRIFGRVDFSVKPTDIRNSNWIPGNGDIGDEWVYNKLLFVTLIKERNRYLIESLGTGP